MIDTMSATRADAGIKVIQAPMDEVTITLAARPEAKPSEVAAATSSCVVHLCGCQ